MQPSESKSKRIGLATILDERSSGPSGRPEGQRLSFPFLGRLPGTGCVQVEPRKNGRWIHKAGKPEWPDEWAMDRANLIHHGLDCVCKRLWMEGIVYSIKWKWENVGECEKDEV